MNINERVRVLEQKLAKVEILTWYVACLTSIKFGADAIPGVIAMLA